MNGELYTFMHESKFGKALVVLVFALAAYVAILIVNSIKEFHYIGGGVPVTNVVTVQGSGEVFAVPDIATFTFTVTEEKPAAKDAQEASAKKINAIIAYLKENGVDEKDIKTVGYNVFPRYEYEGQLCTQFNCDSGQRVLKGFNASQTISVKVRDTSKAGTLLAGAGTAGATEVSGLDFTIDDEDALLKQARKDAIDDARAKAEELAKDLGVKLVRVVNFSESGGTQPPMFYRADTMMAGGKGGAEVAPSVPAGENKLTSSVSITYEIR